MAVMDSTLNADQSYKLAILHFGLLPFYEFTQLMEYVQFIGCHHLTPMYHVSFVNNCRWNIFNVYCTEYIIEVLWNLR